MFERCSKWKSANSIRLFIALEESFIDKVLSISKHVFEDRIRETRSFFHLSIPREILFQYKRFEDKVGDKIAYVLHRASLPKYYISLEKTYTPYIVHFWKEETSNQLFFKFSNSIVGRSRIVT